MRQIDRELTAQNPALHAQIVTEEKTSVFGKYQPIDLQKYELLNEQDKAAVNEITSSSKQNALMTVAIFPAIMLICYIILILYFRAKGGYKPVELTVQK